MQNLKCKIDESKRKEALSILKDIKGYLFYLKEMGLEYIPIKTEIATKNKRGERRDEGRGTSKDYKPSLVTCHLSFVILLCLKEKP